MFCLARAVKGNRSQVTESLCTVKGTLLQIQIFSQSELQYCSVSLVNINRQSVFLAYDNWSLWSETKHKNKPTYAVAGLAASPYALNIISVTTGFKCRLSEDGTIYPYR